MGGPQVQEEDAKKCMANLRKSRGVTKASLTRIRTFVDKFNVDEHAASLLEFRQEELPRICKRFEDIQSQIELITEEPEKEEEERDYFENEYFNLRSRIQEIINIAKPASTTIHNASFGTAAVNSRSRLPPMALPTFDGDIKSWESFFDVYRVMVHEDEGYSPAQKFMYLRSSLTGAALQIIQSVPMTDTNYEVVISRLKQRYDNRSLVIQAHVRSILSCPSIDTPSAQALQTLHSQVCTHLAALKALKQPVEHWDAWLITIVTSRLDSSTAHEWQLRQIDNELPRFHDLERFLASRCTAFENSESCTMLTEEHSNISRIPKRSLTTKKSLVVAGGVFTCTYCAKNHKISRCDKFKAVTVNDRFTFARESRLCFNCLSPMHTAEECKSTYTCVVCKRKHNTLLHFERKANDERSIVITNSSKDKDERSPAVQAIASTSTSLFASSEPSHVFLSTAVVHVQDRHGFKHTCRAVLDNGSQVNFISKNLFKILQLPSRRTEMPVSGIGGSQVKSSSVVEIQIMSRIKQYNMSLSCHVLPAVVNDLSPCPIAIENLKIPNELGKKLADTEFTKSKAIDLLIGGGAFYDILEAGRIDLGINTVKLQETKFGWLITGFVGATCLLGVSTIGETLESEWESLNNEEDGKYGRDSKNNKRALEEKQAMNHFTETARRTADGRFLLRLPMKGEVDTTETTINAARYRFLNVERRLQRDNSLREAYVQFMEEYLTMGHMEEVDEDKVPQRSWYLPHHAVIKSSSLSTKVRVVFDASARNVRGASLNELLLCGPSLQDDIFTILTRFRKHHYVITADVEKMYRQVLVSPEDCDMQRIFWRASPSEQMKTYRLLTVTYGTASASFMVTRCLVELAGEFEKQWPTAAKSVKQDFYMDDLMTGSDSEEEVLLLQQEIMAILESAKLPLRKWCSNSSKLLKLIGKDNDEPLYALEIGDTDAIKSLGLLWKPFCDAFLFNVTPSPRKNKLTKRNLLSDLNRVFDPLGFITPVLIKGKIFLQQLWQLKADWDASLPTGMEKKWIDYYSELEELQKLSIPRCARVEGSKNSEIHGFCDASQEAYGACVYIRSQGYDENWSVQLLCSRSRVAPMKGATIPRLELNGALVLAQLIERVSDAWAVECDKCVLWCDSTVVLSWLNTQPNKLKTYVSNRVNQILEITKPRQWRYVSTNDNPADIISRGTSAQALKDNKLWWNGPKWLTSEYYEQVQDSCPILKDNELPEQRVMRLALIGTRVPNSLIQHYSDWNRLRRGVAWILRFVKFLRDKKSVSRLPYHCLSELRQAEVCILKLVQTEVFNDELQALENDTPFPTRSKLKCLFPFLKNGLILVGGRLQNSDTLETRKHPIVIPSNHRVTQLIFKHKHLEQLHCGPQALLADVRRQYWPLRGRVMARSVVLKCVVCTRAKPRFTEPIMAILPARRVQSTRPFTNTGVDFAGPITIRSGIRKVTNIKAWIAVFICFSTRAVHLEVVEDLSSNAFMAALRRFISRRGRCASISSDNGTNFVGAQRELASYIQQAGPQMAMEGIEWKFNPPSAPHFGGLWESAVRRAKHHLTRIMGEAKLTFSELNTLLCQIEACLNSRPIVPMSNDPSDAEVLTPAHFLIGGSLNLPVEPNVSDEKPGHLRRWKYVQLLMQTFWKRWQAEYLPQLQVRGKWITRSVPVQMNNIVIIKDECMPPTKWKLGRVIKIHPGSDGVVRVVTMRLANGSELKRPVVKVCILPTEEDDLQV